jgi:hypothetical protein
MAHENFLKRQQRAVHATAACPRLPEHAMPRHLARLH